MDRDDINLDTNAGVGFMAGQELAAQLADLTAKVQTYDEGRPYRISPDGTIETVERLQGQPTFRRGDAQFYEGLSFARFVKRFRNGSTVIFADALSTNGPRFVALLDYHEKGDSQIDGAKWDLFRASLPLRHTPNWTTWAQATGKAMAQDVFAQFLEDNIPDIADPAGATLVEIARTLEAATDVQWKSHIRADNGAHQFMYLETVNGAASTKDGKVTIPPEITLVLQPFEGSKKYSVTARFRYRIAGGKVSMWFDLVRLQDVLTEAYSDELLKIDTELNGAPGNQAESASQIVTPIYNGPAPVAQTPKD